MSEQYREGLPCPKCGGIHFGSGLRCPYESQSSAVEKTEPVQVGNPGEANKKENADG